MSHSQVKSKKFKSIIYAEEKRLRGRRETDGNMTVPAMVMTLRGNTGEAENDLRGSSTRRQQQRIPPIDLVLCGASARAFLPKPLSLL